MVKNSKDLIGRKIVDTYEIDYGGGLGKVLVFKLDDGSTFYPSKFDAEGNGPGAIVYVSPTNVPSVLVNRVVEYKTPQEAAELARLKRSV
jgi:hypothetical protein